MAGHSKFKNIMHRKGRADAARSKLFSRLSREITVAAKSGLPDPAMNPRLRLAVNNAKAESLPKDVIQRAINKATSGDAVGALMKLIETLEDDDDVQNVYSNADITAEELEKLAG